MSKTRWINGEVDLADGYSLGEMFLQNTTAEGYSLIELPLSSSQKEKQSALYVFLDKENQLRMFDDEWEEPTTPKAISFSKITAEETAVEGKIEGNYFIFRTDLGRVFKKKFMYTLTAFSLGKTTVVGNGVSSLNEIEVSEEELFLDENYASRLAGNTETFRHRGVLAFDKSQKQNANLYGAVTSNTNQHSMVATRTTLKDPSIGGVIKKGYGYGYHYAGVDINEWNKDSNWRIPYSELNSKYSSEIAGLKGSILSPASFNVLNSWGGAGSTALKPTASGDSYFGLVHYFSGDTRSAKSKKEFNTAKPHTTLNYSIVALDGLDTGITFPNFSTDEVVDFTGITQQRVLTGGGKLFAQNSSENVAEIISAPDFGHIEIVASQMFPEPKVPEA